MKTVKIVPEMCKTEGAKWSGHVDVRVPTFDEKFEYLELISEGSSDVDNLSPKAKISHIRKMVALSKNHYVAVDLKSSEGLVVNSFEAMQDEDDLHAVLIEIGGMMINGFKMGNG